MYVAQSGIFALGTGSHAFLEFDLQVGIGNYLIRIPARKRNIP
jgi:hypothetical protein